MDQKRILIVEPDAPFALSIASFFREEGHATSVAVSAGEAELEIASRQPDLVVMRAELPDLSGFSLCAHLRHDKATARLPVVLYSSDTPPESLAEHARTPWAANGYLAMPLDAAALTTLARRLLRAAEPVELADDAIVEELDPGEVPRGEEPPAAGPASPAAPPEAGAPPALPRRQRRDALVEEDRLFVGRVFQSIANRRDALAAEAERRRPPPRRDLLATPEGRLTLLREDLKWREAQLARLSEIWEVREREVASVDERIHAKDVEVQRARQEAEELSRRLAEAREQLAEKDRAHGASIEGLLLEKFKDEKALIEVVAGAERRLHEQERELHAREDRIARLEAEAEATSGRVARLEAEAQAAAAERAALEGRVEGLDRSLGEAAERVGDLAEQVEARDELLRAARREVERLQQELSAARQALMLRETELRGEVARARSDADEISAMLAEATRDRDEARSRVRALGDDLAAARAEGQALGAEMEAARGRLAPAPAPAPADPSEEKTEERTVLLSAGPDDPPPRAR
jgi:ParB family chromosome partitioning protein